MKCFCLNICHKTIQIVFKEQYLKKRPLFYVNNCEKILKLKISGYEF